MAQLLLCPQTLRCHAAELEPRSDAKGLKLFSDHTPHSCITPPRMKPNRNTTGNAKRPRNGHYSTHPSTSEEIPDFCPTPLCMANQLFTSELFKRWSANAEFPISSLWETKTKVNMPISCLLPSLPEALVGPEPGVWSQCSSLSRHSRVKAQEQKWGHQGAMSG